DGSILFAGRFGEELTIGEITYTSTSDYQQLYIGLLDDDLNLISSTTNNVATFGTLLHQIVFNETTESFYVLGTWGNELHYGQSTPVQGHTGTVQNMYLAKLLPDSVMLDTIIPFIPQTNLFQYFMGLYDMVISENGS